MSLAGSLAIIFLLIFLNGFFAMAELAIVSSRKARLKQRAANGEKGAQIALDLSDDPSSFLSIVQVGMTLISVFVGAYSADQLAEGLAEYLNTALPWLAPYAGPVAFGLIVAGVTYFNLVVGELVPKRIGLSYAEPIAVRAAHVMKFIATVTAPMIWVLRQSTDLVLRMLRLARPNQNTVTEEEVKDIIAEGAHSGVLKQAERSMLEGVMRLADRTVRTVMTPRLDMVWLGIEDKAEEHKTTIRNSGYSRFPVAKGDLEEILGIVSAKDILNAGFDGQPFALKSVIKPALIVPDSTTVLRLLDQFKTAGQHMAIVVDEYGTIEGLVTTADAMEAIMGIMPEHGQETNDKPVQREDGSWLFDGMMPIDEVETLVNLRRMKGDGDFHTLAGFVVDKLGRLPLAGDHFMWHEAKFEVVDMDGRRIDKVIITPPVDEAMNAADD